MEKGMGMEKERVRELEQAMVREHAENVNVMHVNEYKDVDRGEDGDMIVTVDEDGIVLGVESQVQDQSWDNEDRDMELGRTRDMGRAQDLGWGQTQDKDTDKHEGEDTPRLVPGPGHASLGRNGSIVDADEDVDVVVDGTLDVIADAGSRGTAVNGTGAGAGAVLSLWVLKLVVAVPERFDCFVGVFVEASVEVSAAELVAA